MAGVSICWYPYLRKTPFIVSKIKLRRYISAGVKSRVPFGKDGLMDAIGQIYKSIGGDNRM